MAVDILLQADAPTILVVDDTPMNLSVLVRILEGSGYRLLVARNGPAALEIARRTRPDLMLLDIAMPEMTGFEVCRTLKQDPATADTIIIFLSALGDVSDKVSGLELGAADYVTKPFQSEEIIARVKGHLLRKQLERDLRQSRDSLADEMRAAGEMQRLLLPRSLPAGARLGFAARYRPSLHAGGDYYDVVALDGGRVGVFVADVAGHGARAAVVMAMMRTLLHVSNDRMEDPAEVLHRMNRHFHYLEDSPIFATALCAMIDEPARRMRIACAGHPAPLLLRAGQAASSLPCEATMPLFLPGAPPAPVNEYDLRSGDRILFYTDGITDRQTAAGDMFGLEGLIEMLGDGVDLATEALLDHAMKALDTFAQGLEADDDQTLLLASVR